MGIGVIDYGASNLRNVCNALTHLGQKHEIVTRPEELSRFEKLILPGVGAAGSAMGALRDCGLDKALTGVSVPLLGICLGLQLMAEYSEEDETACLGLIPGVVRKFPAKLKVPQIGWNRVRAEAPAGLFDGIPGSDFFYFVNSYYLDSPREYVLGWSSYGIDFASAVRHKNFFAVQFHPEKSSETGLKLLRNFCEKC